MARIGLKTNRKFLRLSRLLHNTALARGVLELLWEPCYESGDAYVGTSDDIEAVCTWAGERGALTKALLEAGAPKGAGFIEPYAGDVRDRSEQHYQIHDFYHHCPEYARARRDRERELTAPKTCAFCREEYYSRQITSQFCGNRCRQAAFHLRKHQAVTEDVTVVTADNAALTLNNGTPTPTPSSTLAVRVRSTLASSELEKNSSSEPPIVEAEIDDDEVENPPVARPHQKPQKRRAPPPPADASPVVLTFPVVGKGGPTWALVERQVEMWQALYPHLDILGLARQALAWVEANEHRRKTVVGMPAFLVAWFNRSSDRRSGGPNVITGSLKTAGNQAALQRFVNRGGS